MCVVIYMYVYMSAYAYGGQGSTLLSSAISVHLFFFFEAGSLTGPIVCCLGWNDWIKTGLYLSLTLTRYTRIRSMHHHDYKFCSCCRSKLSSLSLHRYSVSLLRLGKVQICSQKCVEAILKYRCHCFSFSFPLPPIYYTPQSKKGF